MYNALVMNQSPLNDRTINSQKFRPLFAEHLLEKHVFGIPYPVLGHLSIEMTCKKSLRVSYIGVYSCHWKIETLKKMVVCKKHGKNRKSLYAYYEFEVGVCLDGCFRSYQTVLNF
jgi:hypothetical protein